MTEKSLIEKLNECGFNLISYTQLGGKEIITIVVFSWPGSKNVSLTCKICTTGEIDILNSILITCNEGAVLDPPIMKAIFVDLDARVNYLIKKFPELFKN